MDFRILGTLEVTGDDDAVISLGGSKQRAVLAMLLLRLNQVVSSDVLIDGLWGDEPPASATNVLQSYVSRLRKMLWPNTNGSRSAAPLRRQAAGYILELDARSLDLSRFRQLFDEGRALLHADPAQSSAILSDALSLWRGPALAGFAEPFAQPQRARLDESWIGACLMRIEADMRLGHHSTLVGELRSLCADRPMNEELHATLMLCLYRSGRQVEALEVARHLRATLADELGIDPDPSVRQLEADILHHEPRLDWHPWTTAEAHPITVDAPTVAARAARVWNVPARNANFIGRDDLLEKIGAHFASDDLHLKVVTLYGLGGVGKSQLAMEFAHRRRARYAVVWWIDAEQAALIPDQLATVARRLGIDPAIGTAETVERLRAHLAERSDWLLIFNNAESPEDVSNHRLAGAGHILVTSRFSGWGSLGSRIEVDVLQRDDTVSLLRARVPAMSEDTAAELAFEMGDLPLAASQAAAYLEQTDLDPVQYLRRFRSRRSALLSHHSQASHDGRLDTAWDLSLDRLREESLLAVDLLETASYLAPEPVPEWLFTQNLDWSSSARQWQPPSVEVDEEDRHDAVSDAVGACVAYSLVRRTPTGFHQHRLLQAVIRHRVDEQGRADIADAAMRVLAASDPGSPDDPLTWPTFAQLAPHVLFTRARADTQVDLRRLLLRTVRYLSLRGAAREAARITDELLTRWRAVLGPDHPDTLTVATDLTAALAWLARHEQARAVGQDTMERAQRVLGPGHEVTLKLAMHLVFALAWAGDDQEACRLGEEYLERARAVFGDHSSDAIRMAANLAFAFTWNGRLSEARELAEDTLRRARQDLRPHDPVTFLSAAHLSFAIVWSGDVTDPDMVEDLLVQSTYSLGADHPTTVAAQTLLAFVLVEGDPGRATELSERAVGRALAVLGPDHLITWTAEAVLATALVRAGDAARAAATGRSTMQRAGDRLGPDHLITLAAAAAVVSALLVLGDRGPALSLCREALARSQRRLGGAHLVTVSLEASMHQLTGVLVTDSGG